MSENNHRIRELAQKLANQDYRGNAHESFGIGREILALLDAPAQETPAGGTAEAGWTAIKAGFDYENRITTPTLKISFPPDDWNARDAFHHRLLSLPVTRGEAARVLAHYPPNFVDFPPPALFIQWKGTDLCGDFGCECGATAHIDEMFVNNIKCGGCGAIYRLPHTVALLRDDSVDSDNECIHTTESPTPLPQEATTPNKDKK